MCSVYFLRELNDRAARDPEGFVAESEAAYDRRIRAAAARLREALQDDWLGTYYYYYYCENNDPKQVRQAEQHGVN